MDVIFLSVSSSLIFEGDKINKYCYFLNNNIHGYFNSLSFGDDVKRICIVINVLELNIELNNKIKYYKATKILNIPVILPIKEFQEMEELEVYLFIIASSLQGINKAFRSYRNRIDFSFLQFAISLKEFFEKQFFSGQLIEISIPKELLNVSR